MPLPPSTNPQISKSESLTPGAGFRFSTYDIGTNPGPEYWTSVGLQLSTKFPGLHPEVLWIVGNFMGGSATYLSFQAETDDPHITYGNVDMHEQILDLLDQNTFRVGYRRKPAAQT